MELSKEQIEKMNIHIEYNNKNELCNLILEKVKNIKNKTLTLDNLILIHNLLT